MANKRDASKHSVGQKRVVDCCYPGCSERPVHAFAIGLTPNPSWVYDFRFCEEHAPVFSTILERAYENQSLALRQTYREKGVYQEQD